MSDSNPAEAEVARIDREAAAWIVRRDGGLTPAQQDEFLEWLAADPRHGEWFARHQKTWADLNRLVEWRPEHSGEPNPDLLARPKKRIIKAWMALPLAAAAVFAVFLSYRHFNSPDSFPRGGVVHRPEDITAHYESRVLEDGSVVQLNQGTIIRVKYSVAERRVQLLQGEAHFSVTKNPERPFVVVASGVDVKAVGTAFNMKLDAAELSVLVTEGKVSINPPEQTTSAIDEPVFVEVGQMATIALNSRMQGSRVKAVSDDEMYRLLAWQPRILDFDSTPLRDVVAEFNRRNDLQLVIADADLEEIPIVASFRSDNIEGFVRLLEVTAGVVSVREDGKFVLMKSD